MQDSRIGGMARSCYKSIIEVPSLKESPNSIVATINNDFEEYFFNLKHLLGYLTLLEVLKSTMEFSE